MSHKEDGGGYSQNKYNSFKKILNEALEFLGAIHLCNQSYPFAYSIPFLSFFIIH